MTCGDFPHGPAVRLCAANAGTTGLLPGWRTKIPHAVQHAKRTFLMVCVVCIYVCVCVCVCVYTHTPYFNTRNLTFIECYLVNKSCKSGLHYTFEQVITINSIFRMIQILPTHQIPWATWLSLKNIASGTYFQNCEFVCMITAITNLEFFNLAIRWQVE